MFLVPYGDSDISDSDEDENPDASKVDIPSPIIKPTIPVVEEKSDKPFLNLPAPKDVALEITEEESDDEFLKKKAPSNLKEKVPVKITIPTLSTCADEEDSSEIPLKKFRSASQKGTGLFSILPAPKGGKATLIIPQSVKRNIPTQLKPKPKPTPVVKQTRVNHNPPENDAHEDDDAEITSCDFFSLDEQPEKLPEIVIEKPKIVPQLQPSVSEPVQGPQPEIVSLSVEEEEEQVTGPLGLNEEALRALCGPRGKRRDNISAEILDLCDSDIRPGNEEWLQQAILHGTGPDENSAAAAAKSAPGGILKRKHQITYLAHQAKANEQQLKNTWAQNRATRQQTQSKYGF